MRFAVRTLVRHRLRGRGRRVERENAHVPAPQAETVQPGDRAEVDVTRRRRSVAADAALARRSDDGQQLRRSPGAPRIFGLRKTQRLARVCPEPVLESHSPPFNFSPENLWNKRWLVQFLSLTCAIAWFRRLFLLPARIIIVSDVGVRPSAMAMDSPSPVTPCEKRLLFQPAVSLRLSRACLVVKYSGFEYRIVQ